MQLAAIIFDFYGTLTPGRTVQAQAAARAEQARALGVDPAAFDAALTASYRDRFRGETGDIRQSLAWIAHQLGARPDERALAAATQLRLGTERRFGQPRPEAVPLLQELHARGLRVGVISDCSAELPVFFADLPIAPLIDAAVFSCVTGYVKPDPHNYLLCCRHLEVVPSACMYVGDGGSNELQGATDVGMRAIHLDVAVERGDVVYGRHARWDGVSIASLHDMLSVIERYPMTRR